jgi:hypothetical protein
MSRKVSIMVDVDEALYTEVIEPHKKNRSFSKLILKLLEGYQQDEYVNAYGNDVVAELQAEADSAFQASIDSMKATMINMEILKEEAEMTSEEGIDSFKTGEFRAGSGVETDMGDGLGSERLQRIENEICEMKKSNAEVMSALNLILGKLDGVEVGEGTKKPEKVVEEKEEREVIDLFGLPAPAPVEEKTEEPVGVAEKEEDTVDNGEAEDLLSGLTDGMVFSY